MYIPTVRLALCIVLLLPLPARAAEHPLDPLSYQETWRVLELLRETGHMDRDTRFSELTLLEPDKRDVLAWRPGAEILRAAGRREMRTTPPPSGNRCPLRCPALAPDGRALVDAGRIDGSRGRGH